MIIRACQNGELAIKTWEQTAKKLYLLITTFVLFIDLFWVVCFLLINVHNNVSENVVIWFLFS